MQFAKPSLHAFYPASAGFFILDVGATAAEKRPPVMPPATPMTAGKGTAAP